MTPRKTKSGHWVQTYEWCKCPKLKSRNCSDHYLPKKYLSFFLILQWTLLCFLSSKVSEKATLSRLEKRIKTRKNTNYFSKYFSPWKSAHLLVTCCGCSLLFPQVKTSKSCSPLIPWFGNKTLSKLYLGTLTPLKLVGLSTIDMLKVKDLGGGFQSLLYKCTMNYVSPHFSMTP